MLTTTLHGHTPGWLPSGFGLVGVYANGSADWADGRCREISVTFDPGGAVKTQGSTVGRWTVVADVPKGCGNQILGTARCLDYTADVNGGLVGVQMMGIEPSDGDRIVNSIA
jgi:hypothetical protein